MEFLGGGTQMYPLRKEAKRTVVRFAEKVVPVFVYGTLKRGERNHAIMKHEYSRYISNGFVRGVIKDILVGYPAFHKGGEQKVFGELYVVDHRGLVWLDYLEGYRGPGKDNHFEREKVVVDLGGRVKMTAYVYTLVVEDGYPDVPQGNWTERQEKRPVLKKGSLLCADF
jgi:gamma-glutamylcyclotransferase (GGCT)/AIG2-like uncharacterized protein YtfP